MIFRSPVTHKMAPWVQRVFIKILPKLLCIERPKKEENHEDDQPHEVLTDVFHYPPDVDKFVNYDTKRFSGDYGIPGGFKIINVLFLVMQIIFLNIANSKNSFKLSKHIKMKYLQHQIFNCALRQCDNRMYHVCTQAQLVHH